MAVTKTKDQTGVAEKTGKKQRGKDKSGMPEISFSVSEAYKALRTNINFAIPGSGCKSFIVSSAVLAEGKTTTSTSLALTIAQTNARVVIVDTDMRRPKVHSKFKVVNKIGLSNILSGMCSLDDAIQKVGNLTLDVISAGPIPPNPAELLATSIMASVVQELKNRYDYVILDTPPIDIVSDALSLIKHVDGVVLVVRSHQSAHPEVAAAISRLEFVDAHILGIVLNDVEETTSYYRGHYKRRGYDRYGYGYASSPAYGYGYATNDTNQPATPETPQSDSAQKQEKS